MALSRARISNLILGFCVLLGFLVVGGMDQEWSRNRYYPFYQWQAAALLQGRSDVPAPENFIHDLVPFEGKKYLPLPPLNAVLLAPVVALGGKDASERLFFFPFFVAYVFLFRAWLRREKPDIKPIDEFLWLLFFCLGTPLIISAGRGTAWFSATLTGSFFLALGLYLFQYGESFQNQWCGLFFAMIAAFSRWHFALLIPVMTWVLLKRELTPRKNSTALRNWMAVIHPAHVLKSWAILIPGLLFTALFLGWNYWRFGEFFNLHYAEHGYGGYFQEVIAKYGMTNIHYVWTHIQHGLISPPLFLSSFPFLEFDKEGNGILAMSPLFFYMIFRFPKFTNDIKTALFMMVLVMAPVFTHFSTGWSQHGYRYALDFMPFLFFFLVRANFSIRSPLAILLILISVFMNSMGSLLFNL